MPDFAYIARDITGRRVTGRLSAATQQEALSTLAAKALFPLEVAGDKPASSTWRGRRISGQLMATSYGQLADLLASGVPLMRSLEVLQGQTSHRGLAEILGQVKGHVEEGESLAEAMHRYPRVFSDMAISMVRAGSEGGFLESALLQVADFTEKQEDLKSRTMGAIAYPVLLAFVGALVVSGLIIFVVPRFATLFERLRERGELPVFTEVLLWFSDTLRAWGLPILAVVAVAAFFLRARLATDQGRTLRDRLVLRLPGAGAILLNLAVSRFCRVLGTLLHNGVPILKSLEISSEATGNRVLAQAVRGAATNISAGQALAGPLSKCGYFPPAVVEMIAVAEESNTLETVLVKIADGLDRRTWRRLDLLVRLLEPLMLMLLAAVVLVVVIALLMPVIKMSMTV